MLTLRPYQEDVVAQVRAAMLRGHRRILVVLPCRGGKTVIAATMLQAAAEKGMPSLFTVHRRELILQSTKTFDFAGVPHGVIAPGYPLDSIHPIQIGSILTLSKRRAKLREPVLIMPDEAHHTPARSWAALLEAFPDAWVVGFTATPERLDGKGLRPFFEVIIEGPSPRWMIDHEYLAPYKIYAPDAPDLRKTHTRMGDYVQAEIETEMDQPTVTGNMIEHYQRLVPGKRAILRAVSREHSRHVAAQFCASGIVAVHVDAETPTRDRDDAMRAFRAGHIKVLTNVDLFGEGVDVPEAEVAIDGRPTQSLTSWIQFSMRPLTYLPGKTAVILDHAGNVMRHGLPDEERQWSLDGAAARQGAKKAEQEVKVRLCPGCYAAQPPGGMVCKFCGAPFPVEGRAVRHADGELAEINPEEFRRRHVDRFKGCVASGMTPVEAAYELARGAGGNVNELEWLLKKAKQSGKKPTWAAHVFLARLEKRQKGRAA